MAWVLCRAMKTVVIIALGALVLSGCSSTKSVQEMSYSEVNALASEIAQRCADQGFGDGNPQQESCIQHEVNREIATRQMNQQRQQALGQAFQQMGQSMQQQANRRVTCSTYGNTTSCY